jgi:hypothetical protein
MEDGMGTACSMYAWEIKNAHKILFTKYDGKRPLQ